MKPSRAAAKRRYSVFLSSKTGDGGCVILCGIDFRLFLLHLAPLILHNDYAVCTVNFDEDFRIESVGKVHNQERLLYSLCKNILGSGNELVSAYSIQKMKPKDTGVSYYEHYLDCCSMMGSGGGTRAALEKMIVTDFIIGNTDRHWSNFGILRDAETLKAEKTAPIYDNGASFFTGIHHLAIPSKNRFLRCRSFKSQ